MRYKDLIEQIATRTWQDEKIVERTIEAFGAVLAQLQHNDYVRTPLGTFRGIRLAPKRCVLPGSGEAFMSRDQFKIRLRPGKLLHWDLEEATRLDSDSEQEED